MKLYLFLLTLFALDSHAVPLPNWSMAAKSLLKPATNFFTKFFGQKGAAIAAKVSSAGAAKGSTALRTAVSAKGIASMNVAAPVTGAAAISGKGVAPSLKAIGDVSRPPQVIPAATGGNGFSAMDAAFFGLPLLQSVMPQKGDDNNKPRPGRFSK